MMGVPGNPQNQGMNIFSPANIRSTTARRLLLVMGALALVPLAGFAAALYADGEFENTAITWFPIAAAGAIAAAALLGLRISAGIVGRAAELGDALSRVAREDFTARASERGGDELARVGALFNSLARGLTARAAGRNLVTQLDETLLARNDTGALMRIALRGLRSLSQCEVAIVGVFESAHSDMLRIYMVQKGERSRIHDGRVQLTRDMRQRIHGAAGGETLRECPFPEPFAERLAKEFAVLNFLCLPIAQAGGAWGVMVAAGKGAPALDDSQVELLGNVGMRLIAGFRQSEREKKLLEFSRIDPVTGLPNDLALLALLREQIEISRAAAGLAAVLRLDVDRVHAAREAHGPEFAEQLLRQVANRIRALVREEDVVARTGPTEFTIVLADVQSPREAGGAARKLVQAMLRKFLLGGHAIAPGACVGIALYPSDGESPEVLLRNSGAARDRARAEGGDRFSFAEEPMNLELRRRATLEGELRAALERDEFELHYQPQFDLQTGTLCGVEALVRWRHPSRGLVQPGEFLGFAEEVGLAGDLGDWVLARACESHQRWREQGVVVPRLSVNLARGQLLQPNFVDRLAGLLEHTEMPTGGLELELTEAMLVEGGTETVLQELAKAGVRIAIDDFGTGFSSFARLGSLPVGVLKMDMSFLVDATLENEAGKIVAAIVRMAHALGKEVVAEGVERVEQLKLLKQLSCERAQGFLFGKVVKEAQIVKTFRRRQISDGVAAGEATHPSGQAQAHADPVRAPEPAAPAARNPALVETTPEDVFGQTVTVLTVPATEMPEPMPEPVPEPVPMPGQEIEYLQIEVPTAGPATTGMPLTEWPATEGGFASTEARQDEEARSGKATDREEAAEAAREAFAPANAPATLPGPPTTSFAVSYSPAKGRDFAVRTVATVRFALSPAQTGEGPATTPGSEHEEAGFV
jgi:diguanylate cyclase (GGDEF)-like protein